MPHKPSGAPQFLKRYLLFQNLPPSKIAPFVPQNITIPNPSSFIEKIHRLRYDFSHDHLSPSQKSIDFVADFDFTITKYRHENKYCDATFGIWKRGTQFLPEKFLKQLSGAYATFGPYETDATISFEQKTYLMQQLYHSQLNCFEKYRITEQMVEKALTNANIVFRSHTLEFFQTLEQFQIPLYIISGGISDAIYNSIISTCKRRFHNISIHSNQMQSYTFSLLDQDHEFEQHKFVRFRMKEFVHSYNKYKVMNKIKKRRNCFLMGDLLSDIYMAEGNNYENIISVFYGKEGENDQRALAQSKFDIIVEGDCSHKIIIELLKVIHQKPGVDWEYLYHTNSNLHELLI